MLQALALRDTLREVLRDHTKRAPALGDGHTHEILPHCALHNKMLQCTIILSSAVGEFQACATLMCGGAIVVHCPCGRNVEYFPGFLQRRHRVPSDFLVYDLQFRLRYSHCNAAAGFALRSLMSGRVGIIRSRGWRVWSWRGSEM